MTSQIQMWLVEVHDNGGLTEDKTRIHAVLDMYEFIEEIMRL